ncbi:hypothetical protein A2U01_0080281, partial [Trifolium medium]|nr:hypothetical protein [Trifolium medium]
MSEYRERYKYHALVMRLAHFHVFCIEVRKPRARARSEKTIEKSLSKRKARDCSSS